MRRDELAVNDLDELLNLLSPPLRNHSRRVAVCSAIMAESAKETLNLHEIPAGVNFPVVAHLGGSCHDVGKLFMPTLKTEETAYLKHPAMGVAFLQEKAATLFEDNIPVDTVMDIVRHHHECPNGSGFPDGIRTHDISLAAGICAIANNLDHRLLHQAQSPDDFDAILDNMMSLWGKAFCRNALDCLKCAWPRLREQYIAWKRKPG